MLLISRQYACLSELTDLPEGATEAGEEESVMRLIRSDERSVSSVWGLAGWEAVHFVKKQKNATPVLAPISHRLK